MKIWRQIPQEYVAGYQRKCEATFKHGKASWKLIFHKENECCYFHIFGYMWVSLYQYFFSRGTVVSLPE